MGLEGYRRVENISGAAVYAQPIGNVHSRTEAEAGEKEKERDSKPRRPGAREDGRGGSQGQELKKGTWKLL